jgi:exodeoxyribonuclease VII small subunit
MAKSNRKPLTFEQALERLQQIVSDLEGGELSLDDSLARYEEGRELISGCYEKLQAAERRIEQLLKGEDGELEIKPFEPPSAAAKEDET